MFISQASLENFRCFKNIQDIRLSPLTLLKGEHIPMYLLNWHYRPLINGPSSKRGSKTLENNQVSLRKLLLSTLLKVVVDPFKYKSENLIQPKSLKEILLMSGME